MSVRRFLAPSGVVRGTVLAAVALGLMALAPAGAQAGVVSLEENKVLTYTANAGEVNDLLIELLFAPPQETDYEFTERGGAGVTCNPSPGLRCDIVGGTSANVTVEGRATKIRVFLGDGTDRAFASRAAEIMEIDGGTGSDFLVGSAKSDLMNGGDDDSRDTLEGNAGRDTYNAGPGDDVIRNASTATDDADTVNCGPGTDSTEADDRDTFAADCERSGGAADSDGDGVADSSDACPSQSDLSAPRSPRNGCPADAPAPPGNQPTAGNDVLNGDDLANTICGLAGNDVLNGRGGIDTLFGDACNKRAGVAGSDGNDKLNGGDGNDTLYGAGGNDTLSGGKGNDKLFGGPGVNKYKGGPGNDTIAARNRKKETVDCGPGKRDSATVDKNDKVKGCEKVKRPKT